MEGEEGLLSLSRAPSSTKPSAISAILLVV